MRVKGIASLTLAASVLVGAPLGANDITLSVKPNKCVALRKGEPCYQNVVLTYSSTTRHNVCLVREKVEKPLKCWKNTADATHKYRITASESFSFHIIDANNNRLASFQFTVAWVYKQSRKRNRWRLF